MKHSFNDIHYVAQVFFSGFHLDKVNYRPPNQVIWPPSVNDYSEKRKMLKEKKGFFLYNNKFN